jgi:hypothetical protein
MSEVRGSTRGSRAWRFASGVAMLGLLTLTAGGSRTAATEPAPFTPPEIGVLRLHTGAADYFRFDAADGAGGYTAGTPSTFTASSCVLSGPADLAAVSVVLPATRGQVGFVDDGLGIKAKGEGNGQPCGRVDGLGQALALDLSGSLADLEVDYAELDIEGKFDVVVVADLYLDGDLVGFETLGTGSHSDSGPDSADGDNYRWRIPAEGTAIFDRLVLRVDPSTPGGGFSLHGGADGTAAIPAGDGGLGGLLGTNDSLFHVTDIDGVLDCGDQATAGASGDPTAALDRLANELGSDDDCVPIPYLLRTNDSGAEQTVDLEKDLGAQAALGPRFSMTITWEPEAATYPVVRVTQIDYGSGPHDVQWCDGTPADPELPAGELWCLVSQTADLVATDSIRVTESYRGAGDPRWAR